MEMGMKFIKYLLFIFNLIFAVSIALKYFDFSFGLGEKNYAHFVCVCVVKVWWPGSHGVCVIYLG